MNVPEPSVASKDIEEKYKKIEELFKSIKAFKGVIIWISEPDSSDAVELHTKYYACNMLEGFALLKYAQRDRWLQDLSYKLKKNLT